MIPERTFEVITTGFGHVGSASNDKIPTHTDSLGASMNPDKDEVTFFVRKSLSQQVLANLEENGRATVFAGVASHEAYQFKGHFLEARELTGDELQAFYRGDERDGVAKASCRETIWGCSRYRYYD
ncbi:MAG: hypothetical protein VW162_01010 [Alphaproteobacteria bacterium]